jgi:hypothetical protein
MKNNYFLPRADLAFLQWAVNFLAGLALIFQRIGFPETVYNQLKALLDTFSEKFGIAESPQTRTKASVQEKNDARKSLEKSIQQAYGEYLMRNHLVTDADRDNLGLPIYKTTRTPSPVATTYPDSDVDSSTLRRLTIHFFDQGNKHSKAKPVGQHGAEILWMISDTPIINVEDLLHSSFDTHTPFTLQFKGEERGKTVYFCLCWENTRGEKGPWSPIQSAVIP